MKISTYGHVPVIPPPGANEKDRNLIRQINALFDDLYIKLGILNAEMTAVKADIAQGDEADGNEND